MSDAPPDSDSPRAWFVREILVHEAALMRFMRRAWLDQSEVEDLRQEVYVRVYEASVRLRPASPKAFLFATAKHLMADRIRRSKIVSIEMRGDLDSLNLLVDEISPEQHVGARQDLRRLSEALERIPEECREVVWMRKVEERPQREVAKILHMSEESVERRIARGVRLLANSFFGGGPPDNGRKLKHDREIEHGKPGTD